MRHHYGMLEVFLQCCLKGGSSFEHEPLFPFRLDLLPVVECPSVENDVVALSASDGGNGRILFELDNCVLIPAIENAILAEGGELLDRQCGIRVCLKATIGDSERFIRLGNAFLRARSRLAHHAELQHRVTYKIIGQAFLTLAEAMKKV